jgi:hypothetical protein
MIVMPRSLMSSLMTMSGKEIAVTVWIGDPQAYFAVSREGVLVIVCLRSSRLCQMVVVARKKETKARQSQAPA